MFSAYLCAVVFCCDSGGTRYAKGVEVVEVARTPMSPKACLAEFGISVSCAGVVRFNGDILTVAPLGAKVDSVRPSSPAARAGLCIGDAILEVNDCRFIAGEFWGQEAEVLGKALMARGKSLRLVVSHGLELDSPTETLTIRLP